MQSTDDMEDFLTSLEDQFYQQGLNQGTPHGKLHGLFEGRSLGREKGWELWEEVGYYEGVAIFWREVLIAQGKESSRAMTALDQVLTFVHSFPIINDSTLLEETISNSEVDISALLTSIRTKYRAACASLGIRPRMMAGSNGEVTIQEVNRSI